MQVVIRGRVRIVAGRTRGDAECAGGRNWLGDEGTAVLQSASSRCEWLSDRARRNAIRTSWNEIIAMGVWSRALALKRASTGEMLELNVAIRTAEFRGPGPLLDDADARSPHPAPITVEAGVGGGITIDSDPAAEWIMDRNRAHSYLSSSATSSKRGWRVACALHDSSATRTVRCFIRAEHVVFSPPINARLGTYFEGRGAELYRSIGPDIRHTTIECATCTPMTSKKIHLVLPSTQLRLVA